MIQAIIVEDQVPNYEYLQEMLLKHFPEIKVVQIVDNIPEAIEVVKLHDPDLLFLDIDLPPYTGFNLLEETRGMRYHTIFTTHFNEFAAKAFKFAAIHYLEKPFGLRDLEEAISFYKERTGYMEKADSFAVDDLSKKAEDVLLHNLKETSGNHIVGFPILGGIEFYAVKEIIICKAEGNYTTISRTGKRNSTVTKTLKSVELTLSDHRFFRVHSSYLINVDFIKRYNKGSGGSVIMTNGDEADVARSKKEKFLEYLRARRIL